MINTYIIIGPNYRRVITAILISLAVLQMNENHFQKQIVRVMVRSRGAVDHRRSR